MYKPVSEWVRVLNNELLQAREHGIAIVVAAYTSTENFPKEPRFGILYITVGEGAI